jgi:hypothetical protein
MCDADLQAYGYVRTYTLAKQVSEKCLSCQKMNKQALRQKPVRSKNPRLRPFQNIQVDYTEMPKRSS